MKTMKIFKGAGIFLAIGAVIAFVGGVLYFAGKNKNKAATGSGVPGTPAYTAPTTASQTGGVVPPAVSYSQPIIITNYDTVWDYKLEDGKWYTKKKTATAWTDMKSTLSEANYNLAVQRLSAVIKK